MQIDKSLQNVIYVDCAELIGPSAPLPPVTCHLHTSTSPSQRLNPKGTTYCPPGGGGEGRGGEGRGGEGRGGEGGEGEKG